MFLGYSIEESRLLPIPDYVYIDTNIQTIELIMVFT